MNRGIGIISHVSKDGILLIIICNFHHLRYHPHFSLLLPLSLMIQVLLLPPLTPRCIVVIEVYFPHLYLNI